MKHERARSGLARRSFLRLSALAVATAMLPVRLWAAVARPVPAFKATTLDNVFAEWGAVPQEHPGVEFSSPDIAESGTVVPVEVRVDEKQLSNVSKIYLLVEKNPNPLTAMFMVPEGTEPFIETRVKVAQTCKLYAVVEAGGELYMASKETKVTLGGCGG